MENVNPLFLNKEEKFKDILCGIGKIMHLMHCNDFAGKTGNMENDRGWVLLSTDARAASSDVFSY